ncbi:hypothetical protein FRX31_008650 [Thalictrum thalictroides]|uniref:Uncharacterized protein n=1 Tax=Thalictrum thalictroides TaxID=46969 RepID=A0A7J6WWF9_THATH|nr:hypothetical protein FRX31_008650 [Thalictrum thalictroides]
MGIKGISDALAATNTPVVDSNLLLHTLFGLGVDYESFVTSIYTQCVKHTQTLSSSLLFDPTFHELQSSRFINLSIRRIIDY